MTLIIVIMRSGSDSSCARNWCEEFPMDSSSEPLRLKSASEADYYQPIDLWTWPRALTASRFLRGKLKKKKRRNARGGSRTRRRPFSCVGQFATALPRRRAILGAPWPSSRRASQPAEGRRHSRSRRQTKKADDQATCERAGALGGQSGRRLRADERAGRDSPRDSAQVGRPRSEIDMKQ